MLTIENAKVLAEYLTQDEARAKKLLEMSAEDAAKAISADGIAVTAEELSEFASSVAEQTGELDENALENVSGGVNVATLPLISIIKPFFPGSWVRPFIPPYRYR